MRARHVLPRLAVIVLFGFVARVLRLDFVNLHSDEAFFIQLSYQGSFMRSMSIDEPHPPLFLAMLQAWMGLAGSTEFGIRMLPVLYGTLLIPVVYKLGQELAGRTLGLAGAFVVAANPVFIFYAKEVRDNGLLGFTTALSFVALFLTYRRPKLFAAYVIAALAALASHYYAIPIVGLQLIVLALLLWRDGKLRPWPWLSAPIAFVLAYIPWFFYARSAIGNYNPGRGSLQQVADILGQTARAFNFGFSVNDGELFWPGLGVIALVLLGLAGLAATRRQFPIPNSQFPIPNSQFQVPVFVLGYIVAPIGFGLLTLMRQNNFAPRFLFASAPAYALLLGAGLLLLWRWHWALGTIGCAFLLGLTGLTIRNTDFVGEFQPNGYRELVGYLTQHATSNDGVVLDGTSQWPLYWYYGQIRSGLRQRVEFLPRETLAATEQTVNELLATGSAWYLESDVLRYDPHKDTERLLSANGYQALDAHFAGQRLEEFAGTPAGTLLPANMVVGPLQLAAATRASSTAHPGQPIGAQLDWQRGPSPVPPFKLSLRLEDGKGTVVAQNDTLPLGGYFDFAAWPAGQLMRDRAGLVVPNSIRPGTYRLKAVAYDANTVQGLGPSLDLGTVTVG